MYNPSNVTRATAAAAQRICPSFTGQSIQAQEIAQSLTDSRVTGDLRDLRDSFNTLTSLLDPTAGLASMGKFRFSPNPEVPSCATDLSPLPVNIATAIISDIKSTCPQLYVESSLVLICVLENPPIFLRSWAINDVALVESLFQRIYFPIEPPLGLLTSTYGILHFILKEFRLTNHSLGKDFNVQEEAAECEARFHAGIESYDVLGQPSFETILALTMGVRYIPPYDSPFLTCIFSMACR